MEHASRMRPPKPKAGLSPSDSAIRRTILSVPHGKVASYGEVAEAAGLPRHHRQVAHFLRRHGHGLPWHRILGSGGVIKQKGEWALEQRSLLEMEGVRFRGSRVNLTLHQHSFD